jgi:hypothetical protein
MKGVNQFMQNNFKSSVVTFENCIHAIVYGFTLLEKSKTYSRHKILAEATRIRSKNAKVIELEDYLRNDLVINFIQPNLKDFYLQNYLFIPGVEEISDNIRTGILDIKVCSPSFNGNVYYVFECKRLNKSIIKGYLNEGIMRFTSKKYYPESDTPVAGLISFLEYDDVNNKILIEDSFEKLSTAIHNQRKGLQLIGTLKAHKLTNKKFQVIRDYKYIFKSTHRRNRTRVNIDLFHIVLNYNNLIFV